MTSQSPRIYTYKITFEEVPYYYYGVHKEKYFNEEYWGSPKTNKWCWELYTPKKQILQLFDFTDDGWLDALEVENRLIKPFYNEDKWCLNERCNGLVSLKVKREVGKKMGEICYKNKIGIFSISKEERILIGKKTAKIHKENGTGFHNIPLEKRIENIKKGHKTQKNLGVGLYGMSVEKRKENANKTNSQKWMCLETGFITSPGALSRYQKAREIDISRRKRIE